MIGTVSLSRSVDDPSLSDEVLEATRGWINTEISHISALRHIVR